MMLGNAEDGEAQSIRLQPVDQCGDRGLLLGRPFFTTWATYRLKIVTLSPASTQTHTDAFCLFLGKRRLHSLFPNRVAKFWESWKHSMGINRSKWKITGIYLLHRTSMKWKKQASISKILVNTSQFNANPVEFLLQSVILHIERIRRTGHTFRDITHRFSEAASRNNLILCLIKSVQASSFRMALVSDLDQLSVQVPQFICRRLADRLVNWEGSWNEPNVKVTWSDNQSSCCPLVNQADVPFSGSPGLSSEVHNPKSEVKV